MAKIDAKTIGKFIGTPGLKAAEWMAENAYIAPGSHRLLTAGGLTAGLWGGRKFMDVITARNSTTGDSVARSDTPEILRPLHGVMEYNPYSDRPADRWKFVIDKTMPMAFGALAAYAGGKYYFHGKFPGGAPIFNAGEAVRNAHVQGKFSTEMTEGLLRMRQSDATRKWAATTFVEGSATGMHLTGAFSPFNNGMIAVSFQQGAGRNIWLPFAKPLSRVLGNYGASSRYLFGAMRDTAKWMETNITKLPHSDDWAHPEALLRRARDGLQKLPRQTPQAEQKLADAYRSLIDDAYVHVAQFKAANPTASEAQISEQAYRFISGQHNPNRGLLGSAHDHLLHDLGFDISNIRLGRDPFAFFSRLFGSRTHELELMKGHAEYLNKEFGYRLDPVAWANDQLHMEPWKVAAAYGGGVAAVGTGLAAASKIAHRLDAQTSHTLKPHIHGDQPASESSGLTAPSKAAATADKGHGNLVDWVNGKPLDAAQWLARVFVSPPSMHRFMNAAYLSAVLYGGMKVSNVLTGRDLTKVLSGKFIKRASGELVAESAILREQVWAPFRPLHGLLAYTPGSANIGDRWRQAAHYIMPVSVGMFGTYAGSKAYFKDRTAALSKPETLEDYADRISLEQSKVYAGATALTSIFNTGAGIHLLPIANYSSNLHNRYLMGSGQQVAMPGLGKWWSGNAGMTPWGMKRTLDYMQNYLTYNDAPRPREMPSLVHSLLGKLYPQLSETELLDKKQMMLDHIYSVRDRYLSEGAVTPSKQEVLGKAMKQMLSGAGFEVVLNDIGLSPAEANLANNGASGKIANFFGQKGNVENLRREYREKYARRAANQNVQKPDDFLRGLLDAPKSARPSANDNTREQSFAERARGTPVEAPVAQR